MASSRAPALYSTELLALAIELADYPFDAAAPAKGHARSRSCGSVIDLSSSGGSLEDLGLRVSACAVGQASAAIFARESYANYDKFQVPCYSRTASSSTAFCRAAARTALSGLLARACEPLLPSVSATARVASPFLSLSVGRDDLPLPRLQGRGNTEEAQGRYTRVL